MNLKNHTSCADLRSENPMEAASLLKASMRSYSPRSSGLMPNQDHLLIITRQEAEEFAAGVLRDIDIPSSDKWAICKLIACWLSGEIEDEASTLSASEEIEWLEAENEELRQRPTFQKVQDLLLKLAQQQKEIQRLQAFEHVAKTL